MKMISMTEIYERIKEKLNLEQMKSDIQYKHIKFIDYACKPIEKKNLKNHFQSILWCSMIDYFNPCIIEYGEDYIKLDYNKYKAIRKMLLEYSYCFEALHSYLGIKN